MTPRELAAKIDHTLLRPDADEKSVRKVCDEAAANGFATVCIHPCWVRLAATELKGSGVLIGTVIGFPFGAQSTFTKGFETKEAILQGALELDMVMNIGIAKSGGQLFWEILKQDIRAVVMEASAGGASVKVILECCYLTDEEKRTAAEIVVETGAQYVKTSTGFGPSGATVEDVRLLADAVDGRCKVKAAGGIRDLQTTLTMLDAGADRIGTSAGISILEELARTSA